VGISNTTLPQPRREGNLWVVEAVRGWTGVPGGGQYGVYTEYVSEPVTSNAKVK